MKKHFLFYIFLFAIMVPAFPAQVGIETAKQVGRNYFFRQSSRLGTTDYQSLSLTCRHIEKDGNTNLYYVFDVGKRGFILIAADDASFPVLGYSFDSEFRMDGAPENLVQWMENYKNQLKSVIGNNLSPTEEITREWTLLKSEPSINQDNTRGTTDLEPMLTSNWDQGWPYNEMCPPDAAGPSGHVLVGCVATAMAQVMYYWRYPMTGQGSHCDGHKYNGIQYCANFGNSSYDWNGMADQPASSCDPVALISYQAGIAVDMNYGTEASGAYVDDVPYALKNYFKYATTTTYQSRYSNYNTWITKIKNDLDAGLPVLYCGSGPDGGHCFVCDGYQGTDMFHFNWGWSGYANGYFNLNNLNPGGMTFNNNQGAVFGI